ncbi:hypothetical protein P43SY_001534 [Pythium insidiosum]|uniref:U4/U6.U5 tri-snRNP-associated protein n=1 Tax=Pythium insidiosum TaxID=114742 RepID=A0AAD5M9E0_PYTIN|nr:hypothetical protein P43SY_001534 [Pythium insidiosum]
MKPSILTVVLRACATYDETREVDERVAAFVDRALSETKLTSDEMFRLAVAFQDILSGDVAPEALEKSSSGAKVTEENGEISMSIEETNKLRAALGLKPLSVGPKKPSNVVDLQKSREQVAEEAEREAIKQALAASKKKRELTQKLAGQSIGEQLKAAAPSSALDWVKQSRTAKAAPQPKAKTDKPSDTYDASALAGMTVGHDVSAFEEGNEVVLTLKDARVLTDDGNEVNTDANDELVNVELSEQDRLVAQQKRALRAKMPVYSGYDEDEFIVVGAKRSRRKENKLLAQYDEEADARQAEEARKFVLDADGGITGVADTHVETKTEVMVEDRDADVVVSLTMDKQKAMADYYTKDEMDAMFSKKLRKKKKKEKKKRKQTDDGEVDGEGDGENMAKLLEELEANAGDGSKDRGKRRRAHRHEDDNEDHTAILGEEESLRRFQEAREKANAVAASALAASAVAPVPRKKRRVVAWDEAEVMEDALDLELSATLARTRQLAQLQPASRSICAGASTSEDKIAALVSQTIGNEPDNMNRDDEPAMITATAKATSSGVVLNDATDFETRLRNAMEQRASLFQPQASGEAKSTTDVDSTTPDVKNTANEEDDMEIDEDDEQEQETKRDEEPAANDDEENEAGEQGWGADQPLVGAGMGATLALLRRTGELRETRTERQAGRVNDARDRNVEDELLIKDGVKLDYRDEFGRLLTKKEAFRLMSYKFHGHKPGKKKQEKRLRQVQLCSLLGRVHLEERCSGCSSDSDVNCAGAA